MTFIISNFKLKKLWISSVWSQDNDAILMAVYDALDFIDWIHDELVIYKSDMDPAHCSAFLEYLARKTSGRQVKFESTQRYLIDPKSALEFQIRCLKMLKMNLLISRQHLFLERKMNEFSALYSVFRIMFTSRVWNAATLGPSTTTTGPTETV